MFEVICWPEVQELFDIPGFRDNSLLINDGPLYDKYGDSAYMVDCDWLKENTSITWRQDSTEYDSGIPEI